MRIIKNGQQIGIATEDAFTGVLWGRPCEAVIMSTGSAQIDMRTPIYKLEGGGYAWKSCFSPYGSPSEPVELLP